MSARQAWVFVAGAVLGAGGMWLGQSRAPAPASPPRSEDARPAVVCPAGPSASIAEIRAVVRQELLAAAELLPARAVPAPPSTVAAPPPVEPREESLPDKRPSTGTGREYADAQRVVEGGLSRRSWSQEDRRQVQRLLPLLAAPEREALMRQLIVAANRGELKVDVVGPLF